MGVRYAENGLLRRAMVDFGGGGVAVE